MCSVLEIEAILIARARKKMREANVRLPRNENVYYERMRHKEEDSFRYVPGVLIHCKVGGRQPKAAATGNPEERLKLHRDVADDRRKRQGNFFFPPETGTLSKASSCENGLPRL